MLNYSLEVHNIFNSNLIILINQSHGVIITMNNKIVLPHKAGSNLCSYSTYSRNLRVPCDVVCNGQQDFKRMNRKCIAVKSQELFTRSLISCCTNHPDLVPTLKLSLRAALVSFYNLLSFSSHFGI